MEHPLFIADDDIGSPKLHEALQPVIPVNDPSVEVVEIRGRKAAPVQRNQRSQLRWQDGNHLKDHPFWLVPRRQEGVHDPEAFYNFLPRLLRGLLLHLGPQFLGHLSDVHPLEDGSNGLGPNLGLETIPVLFLELPIALLRQELLRLERSVPGIDDDIFFEVQDPLQVPEGHVEEIADPGWNRFEEPDVDDAGG